MPANAFDALEERIDTVTQMYASSQQEYVIAQETARQSRAFFVILSAVFAGFFLLATILLFEDQIRDRAAVVVTAVVTFAAVIVMVMIDIVHDHIVRRPRHLAQVRYTMQLYFHQQRALVRYSHGTIDEQGIRMIYREMPSPEDNYHQGLTVVFDWMVYTLLFFGFGIFILLIFI